MSSYEQRQAPPGGRSIRVRASGLAQVTESDDALQIRIFRDYDEAMELGEPRLERAAGPDPDSANCPRGYDVELRPDSVLRFSCIQEGCRNGECHIFTRDVGEERWTDRGRSFDTQRAVAFITCGCVRTT